MTWTRRDTATTGFARRTRAANAGTVGPVQGLGNVAYGVPTIALDGPRVLAAWNAQGPSTQANVGMASAADTGATLAPARPFDSGGFSQTSPIAEHRGSAELALYTRQVPSGTGVRNEVVAADAPSGEGLVLGTSATIGTPATAGTAEGVLVAWPTATGGVAVVVARGA